MQQSIFMVDIAMMIAMLVLANLSKRLGEALKVPPFYRILYVSATCVFAALAIDTFHATLQYPVLNLISMYTRAAAGVLACLTCLPYWKWLFGEFFSRQR